MLIAVLLFQLISQKVSNIIQNNVIIVAKDLHLHYCKHTPAPSQSRLRVYRLHQSPTSQCPQNFLLCFQLFHYKALLICIDGSNSCKNTLTFILLVCWPKSAWFDNILENKRINCLMREPKRDMHLHMQNLSPEREY